MEDNEKLQSEERSRAHWSLRLLGWIAIRCIVPLLMVVMLLAGLYIGYVVVGKQPAEEVFEWATWRHMYDLIFAD